MDHLGDTVKDLDLARDQAALAGGELRCQPVGTGVEEHQQHFHFDDGSYAGCTVPHEPADASAYWYRGALPRPGAAAGRKGPGAPFSVASGVYQARGGCSASGIC